MKKRTIAVLVGMMCLTATSSYAQKKNLVKGIIDATTSKVPLAVSAQVERQVARQVSKSAYHPVFGYTYPSALKQLEYGGPHTVFTNDIVSNASLMQVAPILDEHKVKTAFFPYHFLDGAQVTEMIYLWRLANPQGNLKKSPSLFYRLAQEKAQEEQAHIPVNKWENLPNLLLLKRLMQQGNKANSYAELYENITVYPQHITLNEYGFPVETKYADYAKELDLYLMLSNPKEMRAYNNAGKYTPFVLTEEEHEAADDLLALRMREDKLPENPTARDLLGLAYNRLATHTVPYTELRIVNHSRWSVDWDYKTYPNYKRTQLYRSIKGMLNHTETTPDDRDILHLIVLDAVMGGVDRNNLYEIDRALSAFDKLCNIPYNEHTVRHLTALQYNLRFIFRDILLFNEDHKLTAASPDWRKIIVAEKARLLLKRNTAEDLIRNSPLGRR